MIRSSPNVGLRFEFVPQRPEYGFVQVLQDNLSNIHEDDSDDDNSDVEEEVSSDEHSVEEKENQQAQTRMKNTGQGENCLSSSVFVRNVQFSINFLKSIGLSDDERMRTEELSSMIKLAQFVLFFSDEMVKVCCSFFSSFLFEFMK
ncbi:exocyst complex component 6 [Striga asiatica]|uniref:Exocyst complex component 6 n=1 Tax=Striga asiatica TaxID=4170 RepID=A0A5A7QGP7_STRAF|nr:exocyst complex component 6 [Striga asiatica]